MKTIMFYLWVITLFLMFTPILMFLGVLAIVFFAIGQYTAANVIVVLLVIGLVSRATDGFGVKL